MKTMVIAIGGNSLIKDARHMSVPDQYAAVVETARHITDLLERTRGAFHLLRQSSIDEELFDVIAGFDALVEPKRTRS